MDVDITTLNETDDPSAWHADVRGDSLYDEGDGPPSFRRYGAAQGEWTPAC